MRRYLIVAGLILFVFSAVRAEKWKTLGQPISLKDTVAISKILASPENYVGQRVLVKGRVVDVCKKRGCWMEIASDKNFQSIRVKVKDGVIVFPLEARGKTALVEGVVEKLVVSKEQLIRSMKHHAQEQGLPFDSTKITSGKTIYRLKGIGAKIDFSR